MYRVLEQFIAKTKTGELVIQPGQVVILTHEKAAQLLNSGKITPIGKAVYEVSEEKFKELADKLSRNALTADEIKAQRPGIYQQLQEAINEMDSAWLKEDLEAFSKAINRVEELYFEARREIPEA